jgi:tricorn protease interacting factor F2/3
MENFEFSGRTEIQMEAVETVQTVTLNALELRIRECKIRVDMGYADCPFEIDHPRELIHLRLPKPTKGVIEVLIEYGGHIHDRMAGFYRSKTVSNGKERFFAVTQFEESDARRAFPCFDHPKMKATFDVVMSIDKNLTAISNSPVQKECLKGGKKITTFARTPKMSTYLLFWGVGEFEMIEEKGQIAVKVATPPGMTRYGRFGLSFAVKALGFSESYYGIPYPLPKMDLIAIADFSAGAMENWGAITFRENLLLHYPGVTPKVGELRIYEVIAHEIAHQWFGNLVTPADWAYLWLNESFATYFGFKIVDHYYPEWGVWDQFRLDLAATAMERDALVETYPIEIPGGEHAVINVATAPIIYNKGGCILQQVEGYLGDSPFQEGLRLYLNRYAYGCASSRDLWAALEESSGLTVSKLMESWVEQPGFPMVDVRKEGGRLLLRQSRFTYLSNQDKSRWVLPLSVQMFSSQGTPETVTVLFEEKEHAIPLGKKTIAYKVNAGQTGFYRVRYRDKNNLHALGTRIHGKELLPEDRWGLQDDFYALVKRGEETIGGYFRFLSYYEHEDDPLCLMSMGHNLFDASLILGEVMRQRIADCGKGLFERVLEEKGYEPHPHEIPPTAMLRDRCMLPAVMFGSKKASSFALTQFERLQRDGSIHADIMKCVMQVGAHHGDYSVFEWFAKGHEKAESEQERMNVLMALGKFREKKIIKEVLRYALETVPDRNKFVLVGSLSSNPQAMPFMWEWFLSSRERLEDLPSVHFERIIAAIVPFCGLGKEDEVEAFFSEYLNEKKKARDAIKISLERLRINSRMRKRAKEEINQQK